MTGAFRVCLIGLAVVAQAASRQPEQSFFSPSETQAIINFWENGAHYEAQPSGDQGQEWCVRLTPSGSKWIREVYRQFTSGKVMPTRDPQGNDPRQQAWVAWIDRQVERDWTAATAKAEALNVSGAAAGGATKSTAQPLATQRATLDRKVGTDKVDRTPEPKPFDDPCPSDLVALVGQAPAFAAPVRPMRHTVTFPDGLALTYVDNVRVRPKYAYYRFAEGVNSEGVSVKKLAPGTVEQLFKRAGMSVSEQRVMKSVSLLEGGFDSVNTYDTGYVSVGFIQFACLGEGSGSLGKMMLHYKNSNQKGFANDFHLYGIDVDEHGCLVALDLESGAEKTGAEAALQIIHDKRLVAAFQRAGLQSDAFKIAQLQAAKNQFYPANDVVSVCINGCETPVRLGDVFRSEAGMATLMDRKVNTGKIAGLKESLDRAASLYGFTQAKELCDAEYQVTRDLTYRQDYLVATGLTKPRDNSIELSRRGKRFGRKGGSSQ
ncbi:MAG: hypothetical protein JSS66_16475 [Armatimonadetes bacterium]|nr:hypothetical protein [Armatimonadota bacterium]